MNFAAPTGDLEKLDDQLLMAKLREYYADANEETARADLTEKYGQVWNDSELLTEFAASIFDGPVLRVIRKADGVRGAVAYIDKPRLYFAFAEDAMPESCGK
jgi:hypothetical protein